MAIMFIKIFWTPSYHWRGTSLWGCVPLRDDPTVVGHLLRALSRICSLFSFHDGITICIELQGRKTRKVENTQYK